MKAKVCFASFLLILSLTDWSLAYHPEFSWENADSMMTGDLRYRMMKQTPTRRRYCDCEEVEEEDNYPICASNKGLYMNACLYRCAKVRSPDLTEVDITLCGTHTFKEFKLGEFRPHY